MNPNQNHEISQAPEAVAETEARRSSNQFFDGLSNVWQDKGTYLKKLGLDVLSVGAGVLTYEIVNSMEAPAVAFLAGLGAAYLANYAAEVAYIDKDRTILPPVRRWLAEAVILGMLVLAGSAVLSAPSAGISNEYSVYPSVTPTETVTPTATPTEFPTMTPSPTMIPSATMHPIEAAAYNNSTVVPPLQAAQIVNEMKPVADQMVEQARTDEATKLHPWEYLAGVLSGLGLGVLFRRRK